MSDPVSEVLAGIQSLRHSPGDANQRQFWIAYCQRVAALCVADAVLVVWHGPTGVQVLGTSGPDVTLPVLEASAFARAIRKGFAVSPMGNTQTPGARVLVPLLGGADRFLCLLLPSAPPERLNELVLRARLVADVAPGGGPAAEGQEQALAAMLQLASLVYTDRRFATAAYRLVNGLVSHDETIGLAALGWREGAYVRLIALSHHDQFERRAEWVRRIETALEEAADQDRMIDHVSRLDDREPSADATGLLTTRAHEQLLVLSGARQAITVPVGTMEGGGEMVLMVLGFDSALSPGLSRRLSFLAELIEPVMRTLKRRDAGLWQRLRHGTHRGLSWLFGSDRVAVKVATVLLSAGLLYGVFGTLPHRVEGFATLVTDQTRIFAAPFDGTVEEASRNPGESVDAGETLIVMETEDLLLQRGELQADLRRQLAEVRRARTSGQLVEAEIASARSEQIRARLDRVEADLERAVIRAGSSGVVVEGERQALLGLPVRQGDPLYRLARLEALYLRIDVPEVGAHFVEPGEQGEFAFLSRPGVVVPIRVTRVIPMARVRDGEGAVFEVVAQMEADAEDWWRPGMEGIAKIDQGDRAVFWVLGHRLFDRLRIWFWW